MAEQYPLFGPSYLLGGDQDGNGLTDGRLLYRPAAPLPVWDEAAGGWVEVDPETGQGVPARAGAAPSQALCEECTDSAQCLGYTGSVGGTFCQPLEEEGGVLFCVQVVALPPELEEWQEFVALLAWGVPPGIPRLTLERPKNSRHFMHLMASCTLAGRPGEATAAGNELEELLIQLFAGLYPGG